MSPLRYQKWLRLNEVRRPMLNEHYDVTTAAYAVGYNCPKSLISFQYIFIFQENMVQLVDLARCVLIPSDFPAL